MIREKDLPCSECGADLVERRVHVRDLSMSTEWRGFVTIAECPLCGSQYYPESALSKLTSTPDITDSEEAEF